MRFACTLIFQPRPHQAVHLVPDASHRAARVPPRAAPLLHALFNLAVSHLAHTLSSMLLALTVQHPPPSFGGHLLGVSAKVQLLNPSTMRTSSSKVFPWEVACKDCLV